MKTQVHRKNEVRQLRFVADLEATIAGLFLRCPTLCGFTVRGTGRLVVTEVSVYPLHHPDAPPELCHEIVEALAGLIDEIPEAGEWLRERTFARVLH
jgi:hypothetical protein